MTDNREITFAQSDDPQACQTNESVYMEFTRDPVRTPFQWDDTQWAGFSTAINTTWLPIHKNYREVNLKAQKAAEKSTYKLYQNLIKLRKENHVLQSGEFESKVLSEYVFAFTRTLKDHNTVAVFINLGGSTTTSLKALLKESDFADNTKAQILIVNKNSTLVAGKFIDDLEKIELGEYDAIVLEVSSATKLAMSMLFIVTALIKFIF